MFLFKVMTQFKNRGLLGDPTHLGLSDLNFLGHAFASEAGSLASCF